MKFKLQTIFKVIGILTMFLQLIICTYNSNLKLIQNCFFINIFTKVR